jgi:hypothetical protein
MRLPASSPPTRWLYITWSNHTRGAGGLDVFAYFNNDAHGAQPSGMELAPTVLYIPTVLDMM